MTITYAFLGGALILVAGVRYRHLVMLAAVVLLALPLLAASLQGYMLARLCIFLPTDEQGQIARPVLDFLHANFETLLTSVSRRRPTPQPPTTWSKH